MNRAILGFAAFLTISMLPLCAQPVLNTASILNASGYQNQLAPDTVFVIFGNGLGPATIAVASAPNYPTSVGGTSVIFAPLPGGVPIMAKMIYSVAGQVAGLLPSSITPGAYAVTVSYNNQNSAPQNVMVVPRSFGIATANSSGSGPAQATIGNVNGGISLARLTTSTLTFGGLTWPLQPAHPGDTLVLWGTGGGADPLNDTGGTSGDQTKAGNFMVNVGGTEIVPEYAGASSGYPGLWQINFTLPTTVTPNCFAYVQVSAAGQVGNAVSIPIAPTGQSSCSTPQLSQSLLSKLDAGGNVIEAQFSVGLTTEGGTFPTTSIAFEGVGGNVAQFSAAEWESNFFGLTFGSCTVTYPQSPNFYLNAGPSFTFSGPGIPAGTSVGTFTLPNGLDYQYNPPSNTMVPGGTYTMTSPGGTQVDPFTATATVPSSFTVTNWSSLNLVNRAQPLTVNWTGSGFDQIQIYIQGPSTAVRCTVPASLGSYTIPAAALGYLPATASGQISVTAQLAAASFVGTSLTPGLVAGGQADFGTLAPFLATLQVATIQ
jgi:uncharacterized protein (TIGR03437 family)